MNRPILVTGSHRCGSTWVGRNIARSSRVAYVEEPFHPRHRPGICRARPDHWYQYVTERSQDEADWHAALSRTIALRYDVAAEARALRSPRDLGRLFRDWSRFTRARRRGARALLKDPIAFFSAPWIARRFEAQVVVLTRHPAAFASSLKRLSWTFDVGNWLEQPQLVEEVLSPWEAELNAARADPGDVIDQAALCWKVIANVTLRYQDEHPDWIFLTHEELSLDPRKTFEDLFGRLDLPFEEELASALEAGSSASNPAEAPAGTAHALKRDSRANISNWRQRLEPAEVERLRETVEEVSCRFYGDETW